MSNDETKTNRVDKFESIAEKPNFSLKINNNDYRILKEEDENWIDDKVSEMRVFMKNNDGEGKTSAEKDELYREVQEIWGELGGPDGKISKIEYGFILTRPQYNHLIGLLRDKVEYDVNTIFFAIELTNFLGKTVQENEFEDDHTPLVFDINATDMTYLYTCLSQHKSKGLTKKTYTFAEIIRRIGDISKVINHLDSNSKDLSTEIQNWASCLDDGVSMEGESVKGEKVD
jgi:hypothetical protein